MEAPYRWSASRRDYQSHNIIYATCGIMSSMGLVKYLEDRARPFEDMVENPTEKDIKELEERQKALNESTQASNLFHQLLFSNAVDNFNCYMSSIVGEILEADARPIFGKKFDASIAFNVGDIESLRRQIIEKQILDMGYQNISDLVDFLEKNFGICSLSHWLTKLRLNRIVQTRNIITHNRGVVNATYLFRSKSKTETLGQLANVRFPLRTSDYLLSLVERIDREAVAKFKLGGVDA